MISRAVEKYLRISSKKMRMVVDVFRGKSVKQALEVLPSVNKKAAAYIIDAVKSAFANAKVKNPEAPYTEDMLFISKITANEGPMLKRYRAASMGRASPLAHRTSHLLVELDIIPEKMKELEAAAEKKGKKGIGKLVSRKKGKKEALATKGSK